MTDQERLEYIKILHDEANEIGKNGEKDSEEKIIDILRRLFYQAHTDWLIAQAELLKHAKEQIDVTQSRNERLEKRMKQLEKELLFTQESLKNSTKICATQFENMQRYVKALKFYADEDIYTVLDGERIKGIFTDQGEKARQALKGDTNA